MQSSRQGRGRRVSVEQQLKRFKSRALFTIVGGVIVINPAFAQDASQQVVPPPSQQAQSEAAQGETAAKTLDTVTISGLRGSLDHSMNIKRDEHGVVDAISAEDIGKFPDTNLAESLQRITGISIERRNGEGAQVTARGFGPEFNEVTLNGRQIPGADAFGAPGQTAIGGVDTGTRAFNFAQLSADAISGIEVFKTSRANEPSGGIGATIDVQTDKPFNHKGGEVVASIGAKGSYDDSAPYDKNVTPQLSGIFSYANPDKTWGVSVNASYEKRHGGSVQATENTWNVQPWTGTDAALRPDANVQNAPAIGQLYALPNDLRYAFEDFQNKRVNGQATLQFAPTDSLTFTLDYTYADNQIIDDRGEESIWLQRSNSLTDLVFDTGNAVATPVYLRDIPTGNKDFGLEQQHNEQEYKLGSLGLNARWEATDRLHFVFDAHDSKTQSLPNDPLTGGGSTAFSLAGTNNCTNGANCGGEWAQELWFNGGLPQMARTWYPSANDAVAGTNGSANQAFTPGELGSQVIRIDAQTQITEIKEGRVDGEFDFDNGRFQFGIDHADTKMHRTIATQNYAALGDWGVANAGQYPDMMDLLQPINIAGLFNDYNASGTPTAWRGNADDLTQWATQHYSFSTSVNPQLASDNRVEEKTSAVYMQLEMSGQLGRFPTNTRFGVRYEKTDVISTSQVAIPDQIVWQSNNDFMLTRSSETQAFSEKASYDSVLPSLDFDIDLTDNLKGRASFGKSQARAPYNDLIAGPTPGNPTGSDLINSSSRASGSAQNPSLKPLDSDNLDFALEWYFAPASYVSVTFWNKEVDNFVGSAVTQESLYGLRDPTAGPDAQAALAFLQGAACQSQVSAAGNDVQSWCSANDTALFDALAMLRNEAQSGGLAAYNGSGKDKNGADIEAAYDVTANADDPLYMYNVTRPVNQHKANLYGWEFGGQYFFGESGFGVQANYTIVQGDVHYNDAGDPNVDQFALTGLSDTANAVLMYEKYGWSARLAWNWRDKYLIAANMDGSNRNPYYVEAYQQLDLGVNYKINDHFTVSLDGINLTGEDVRWHARSTNQVIKLLDQSPRYMLGARYSF